VAVWSFPVLQNTPKTAKGRVRSFFLSLQRVSVVSTAAPNHLRPVIFTSLLFYKILSRIKVIGELAQWEERLSDM
jgi:hypothetical protein